MPARPSRTTSSPACPLNSADEPALSFVVKTILVWQISFGTVR